MRRSYRNVSLTLTPVGIGLVIVSYTVLKTVPITALGIACIVLGLTAATLPEELTGSGAMKMLLGSAAISTQSMLEELEARGYPMKQISTEGISLNVDVPVEDYDSLGTTIYLPPKNGLVAVFLPLCSKIATSNLDAMWGAPKKLTDLKDCSSGFVLFPIGSEVGEILTSDDHDNLEETLRFVLVESAQLCSSVKADELEDLSC